MANAKEPILNPDRLPLPVDEHGFTNKMKREIARAIGRVGPSKQKQDVLVKTLSVFMKYAKDRHGDAIKRAEVELSRQRKLEAARAEKALQDAAKRAADIRSDAEQLLAQADMIDGGSV